MGYQLLSEIFSLVGRLIFPGFDHIGHFVINQLGKWWLAKVLINSMHVRWMCYLELKEVTIGHVLISEEISQ